MDKFKTQKDAQNINLMKPPIQQNEKKRAISAKYDLKTQSKAVLPKPSANKNEQSIKLNVIEALREENKKIGREEEK